jgi:hypothetical protein
MQIRPEQRCSRSSARRVRCNVPAPSERTVDQPAAAGRSVEAGSRERRRSSGPCEHTHRLLRGPRNLRRLIPRHCDHWSSCAMRPHPPHRAMLTSSTRGTARSNAPPASIAQSLGGSLSETLSHASSNPISHTKQPSTGSIRAENGFAQQAGSCIVAADRNLFSLSSLVGCASRAPTDSSKRIASEPTKTARYAVELPCVRPDSLGVDAFSE